MAVPVLASPLLVVSCREATLTHQRCQVLIMGCAASVPGGSKSQVQPNGATSVVPTGTRTKSPIPSERHTSSKTYTVDLSLEPLQRLQSMILEMGHTGKVELTSVVAREGSGQEQGTLTTAQISSLRQIPAALFDMKHLTELSVLCNQIFQIPKEINQLQALEVLNLSENQLTELPPEITELASLRVLEVAENHLISLPEAIGRLTKLEILRANRNKLTNVPDDIRRCARLKVLNLYNNTITTVGDGLADLMEMEELTVSNNLITTLPSIHKWKKIKYLYLQVNKLTSLPPLDDLPELELLQAHQNALTQLPSMEKLPLLKKIDVNSNMIEDVPECIARMPQIVHLGLRKNKVEILPPFLGYCRTLEILDFGNNPVCPPIPAEIARLSNLKTLLLDGTSITHLPIEMLGLRNLIRAHLGGCLRMDDPETAEVVMDLRTRCQQNKGWLKTGG